VDDPAGKTCRRDRKEDHRDRPIRILVATGSPSEEQDGKGSRPDRSALRPQRPRVPPERGSVVLDEQSSQIRALHR